jgi:predicted ATPase/DNA-binding CsgD family transcriptional regulator
VVDFAVVSWFGAADLALRGRDEDLAEVVGLLDRGARVVTITGRGGVGKTTLATAVVREIERRGDATLAVVALDRIADPSLVPSAIADALGLPRVPGDLVANIAAHVGTARTILLLDNFEHLLPAAVFLVDLVAAAPALTVLVTSQSRLHLRAEHVVALDPLQVPESGETDLDALQQTASVSVYCDRARAVDRTFRLDAGNAWDVAELCRLLDGVPLALELAAARSPTLPPAAMVAELGTRPLDVLSQQLTDVPDRQRSLRQSITWTMDLLAPGEQTLLQRLSVAAGAFDVAVAEHLDDDPSHALDHLAALVDLHLIEPAPGPGGAWFRMPPTIRTLAGEQLEATGQGDAVRTRHTDGASGWVRQACLGSLAPGQTGSMGRLAARQDDLVACLGEALRRSAAEPALDLANALAMHWSATGYRRPQEGLLEETLDLAARTGCEAAPAGAMALAWSVLLAVENHLGIELPPLLDRLARAESTARATGESDAVLHVLACATVATAFAGDIETAATAGDEGLRLACELSDPAWQAAFEVWNGMLAHHQGDQQQAVELGRRGLARAATGGDERTVLLATMLLLPLRSVFPELAGELRSPAAAHDLALGCGEFILAEALLPAVIVEAATAGDVASASRHALDALRMARTGPAPVAGFVLLAALQLLDAMGRHGDVVWLGRVLDPGLPLLEPMLPRTQVTQVRRILARAPEQLSPSEIESTARRADGLTWGDAVRRLEDLLRPEVAPAAAPATTGDGPRLTPRQTEVLRLVASGRTNREVAAELGLTPKTVMHHLGAIYVTLGVRSRSEATVWAFRAGLVD